MGGVEPFARILSEEATPATDDHAAATDDHGGSTTSHTFSLFGAISGLGVYAGTISVLIIVLAVQCVEYLFNLLHVVTHDTPFNKMVQSIEKELMGVGFTAFAFKIVVDTTHFLDLEWFHALEYADILVPIFSFAYCGLGLMLILNSIQISNIWSQAYHLSLTQMLDNYFNLPGFVGYLPYGLWLAPLNLTIARMEFRIFQSIFCETYKIQKAAFAFNEYVEKVFEKYILMIIEIRYVDWFSLCSLVLLNWARNKLHLNYRHCVHHDIPCEENNATIMFTIAGAIILTVTVLMALESRRLEVSIMRQKGIRSVHTYPSYLKYMEDSAEAKAMDAYRLTKDELKASAEGVKYSAIQGEMEAAGVDVPAARPNPPAGGHGAGAGNAKNANQFSQSVKQAWKTKKNVVKRRKSVTTLNGTNARMTVRRQSMVGGMGFPNIAHLVALRTLAANKAGAVAAIAEDGDDSDGSSGPSSSSSSSSASDDSSGSEEFDVNARKKHRSSTAHPAHALPSKKAEGAAAGGINEEGEEEDVGDSTPPTAPTSAGADAQPGTITAAPSSNLVPLKRLPPIGVNPWKAAPLHKKNGFLHVFTRMQSSIDGLLSAAPQRETLYHAQHQAPGEDGMDREDSKQEWSEMTSLRKKQLPPIRSAPGSSFRSPNGPNTSLQVKPGSGQSSIFEKTLVKLDAAGESAGTELDGAYAVPLTAGTTSSRTPASRASPADAIPPALAQAGLSMDTLMRSRISPARSSGVKRMSPGSDIIGAPAVAEAAAPVTSSPARIGGSPAVPRGALINVNTSKSAAVALAGKRKGNSSSSEASNTPPSSSAAATAGNINAGSPEQAPNSSEKKSLRFSDIEAVPLERVPSRKHKESVAGPPLGSLRYTAVRSDTDTATASTSTAAAGGSAKGTAEAGGRVTFTYAPPPSTAAAAASALAAAAGAAAAAAASAPHADEEEEVPIANVFFLAWPELYLEGVQSLIMIIALYIALYFTNFVAAAHSAEWKLIPFIPAVVSAVLLVYITKCAVMLASIHAVDCDAILEVLEQTEGAAVLSALIKQKVIALLAEMGPDPQAELVNLFSQIDSDGSGSISRDEFAEYMNSIEIHFDRKRWMQVFRSIDTTFDNKITFEEFYMFLFPDHTLGKAMHQRREDALQKDLKEKSELRLAKLKRFTRGQTRMTFVPTKKPALDIEQGVPKPP